MPEEYKTLAGKVLVAKQQHYLWAVGQNEPVFFTHGDIVVVLDHKKRPRPAPWSETRDTFDFIRNGVGYTVPVKGMFLNLWSVIKPKNRLHGASFDIFDDFCHLKSVVELSGGVLAPEGQVSDFFLVESKEDVSRNHMTFQGKTQIVEVTDFLMEHTLNHVLCLEEC